MHIGIILNFNVSKKNVKLLLTVLHLGDRGPWCGHGAAAQQCRLQSLQGILSMAGHWHPKGLGPDQKHWALVADTAARSDQQLLLLRSTWEMINKLKWFDEQSMYYFLLLAPLNSISLNKTGRCMFWNCEYFCFTFALGIPQSIYCSDRSLVPRGLHGCRSSGGKNRVTVKSCPFYFNRCFSCNLTDMLSWFAAKTNEGLI